MLQIPTECEKAFTDHVVDKELIQTANKQMSYVQYH